MFDSTVPPECVNLGRLENDPSIQEKGVLFAKSNAISVFSEKHFHGFKV
jgi:hypothetical protein